MSIRDIFSSFTNINTEQFQAFIDANKEGSFTLLDVRQPSEYESARIPGSLLMPLPSLSEQLQELAAGHALPFERVAGGRQRGCEQACGRLAGVFSCL